MSSPYTLTVPHFLTSSGGRNALLRDYALPEKPEIDAKVRSGDYFIHLATSLDTIAAELTETSPAATSMALAEVAAELEYVQTHYQITRKAHPDRLSELR